MGVAARRLRRPSCGPARRSPFCRCEHNADSQALRPAR
jgi:hypothetical protein